MAGSRDQQIALILNEILESEARFRAFMKSFRDAVYDEHGKVRVDIHCDDETRKLLENRYPLIHKICKSNIFANVADTDAVDIKLNKLLTSFESESFIEEFRLLGLYIEIQPALYSAVRKLTIKSKNDPSALIPIKIDSEIDSKIISMGLEHYAAKPFQRAAQYMLFLKDLRENAGDETIKQRIETLEKTIGREIFLSTNRVSSSPDAKQEEVNVDHPTVFDHYVSDNADIPELIAFLRKVESGFKDFYKDNWERMIDPLHNEPITEQRKDHVLEIFVGKGLNDHVIKLLEELQSYVDQGAKNIDMTRIKSLISEWYVELRQTLLTPNDGHIINLTTFSSYFTKFKSTPFRQAYNEFSAQGAEQLLQMWHSAKPVLVPVSMQPVILDRLISIEVAMRRHGRKDSLSPFDANKQIAAMLSDNANRKIILGRLFQGKRSVKSTYARLQRLSVQMMVEQINNDSLRGFRNVEKIKHSADVVAESLNEMAESLDKVTSPREIDKYIAEMVKKKPDYEDLKANLISKFGSLENVPTKDSRYPEFQKLKIFIDGDLVDKTELAKLEIVKRKAKIKAKEKLLPIIERAVKGVFASTLALLQLVENNILRCKTQQEAVLAMDYWLRVAKECLESPYQKNFHAYEAIMAAVTCTSITKKLANINKYLSDVAQMILADYSSEGSLKVEENKAAWKRLNPDCLDFSAKIRKEFTFFTEPQTSVYTLDQYITPINYFIDYAQSHSDKDVTKPLGEYSDAKKVKESVRDKAATFLSEKTSEPDQSVTASLNVINGRIKKEGERLEKIKQIQDISELHLDEKTQSREMLVEFFDKMKALFSEFFDSEFSSFRDDKNNPYTAETKILIQDRVNALFDAHIGELKELRSDAKLAKLSKAANDFSKKLGLLLDHRDVPGVLIQFVSDSPSKKIALHVSEANLKAKLNHEQNGDVDRLFKYIKQFNDMRLMLRGIDLAADKRFGLLPPGFERNMLEESVLIDSMGTVDSLYKEFDALTKRSDLSGSLSEEIAAIFQENSFNSDSGVVKSTSEVRENLLKFYRNYNQLKTNFFKSPEDVCIIMDNIAKSEKLTLSTNADFKGLNTLYIIMTQDINPDLHEIARKKYKEFALNVVITNLDSLVEKRSFNIATFPQFFGKINVFSTEDLKHELLPDVFRIILNGIRTLALDERVIDRADKLDLLLRSLTGGLIANGLTKLDYHSISLSNDYSIILEMVRWFAANENVGADIKMTHVREILGRHPITSAEVEEEEIDMTSKRDLPGLRAELERFINDDLGELTIENLPAVLTVLDGIEQKYQRTIATLQEPGTTVEESDHKNYIERYLRQIRHKLSPFQKQLAENKAVSDAAAKKGITIPTLTSEDLKQEKYRVIFEKFHTKHAEIQNQIQFLDDQLKNREKEGAYSLSELERYCAILDNLKNDMAIYIQELNLIKNLPGRWPVGSRRAIDGQSAKQASDHATDIMNNDLMRVYREYQKTMKAHEHNDGIQVRIFADSVVELVNSTDLSSKLTKLVGDHPPQQGGVKSGPSKLPQDKVRVSTYVIKEEAKKNRQTEVTQYNFVVAEQKDQATFHHEESALKNLSDQELMKLAIRTIDDFTAHYRIKPGERIEILPNTDINLGPALMACCEFRGYTPTDSQGIAKADIKKYKKILEKIKPHHFGPPHHTALFDQMTKTQEQEKKLKLNTVNKKIIK